MSGVDEAFAHISRVIERRNAATGRLVETTAREMLSYARSHARWRDQSGEARATLDFHVERRSGGRERHSEYVVVGGYGSSHGQWLESHEGAAMGRRASMSAEELMERRNAGRLAIINPTVDIFLPRLLRAVRQVREAIR